MVMLKFQELDWCMGKDYSQREGIGYKETFSMVSTKDAI